jgi:hypothetical protein
MRDVDVRLERRGVDGRDKLCPPRRSGVMTEEGIQYTGRAWFGRVGREYGRRRVIKAAGETVSCRSRKGCGDRRRWG